jgi:DNA topoisomerase IA/ssDNA-binding Zn-finger/Zn-ribbon topoisomerase 1
MKDRPITYDREGPTTSGPREYRSSSSASVIAIISDDNHIAKQIFDMLERGNKRRANIPPNAVFYRTQYKHRPCIILSTNGHLQVPQNSSVYKWSGIDPQKIIEDENSVIPVLNSFNKKNYYAISKTFTNERIDECILVLTPDMNAITIGLKELGRNIFLKAGFTRPPKKVLATSLDVEFLSSALEFPQEFTFADERASEIEYIRSYLDAVISFSTTQEITYTIKRCLSMNVPAFKDLKETFRQDMRDQRNLLIPMSRAQALILTRVFDRNKTVSQDLPPTDPAVYELSIKIKAGSDEAREFSLLNIKFAERNDANDLCMRFKKEKHLRIKKITTKEVKILPPAPYDLISIIEHASDDLGFPATYTYKLLLDLYHERMITYPNSDLVWPVHDAAKHLALLHAISEDDEFEDEGKQAAVYLEKIGTLEKDRQDVFSGKIQPIKFVTKNVPFFATRPNHWKIFTAILHRYVLQFLPPAITIENHVQLDTKALKNASIMVKTVKEDGFFKFFPSQAGDFARGIDLNALKSFDVVDCSIKPEKSSTFFNDATLLKEIKEHNLGDTVSHLLMIEKLIANNYLQVVNRNLKLTRRGELIAEFLGNTFDFLGNDAFTRFFRAQLQAVEGAMDGKDLQSAVSQAKRAVLSEYLSKFAEARERTNTYLMKQGIDLSSANEPSMLTDKNSRFQAPVETFIYCDCGSPMKIVETKSKARFLACENRLECGKTYALPREGKITILNKSCAICENKAIRIESTERGTYFLCPTCCTHVYGEGRPFSVGYCATCEKRAECWTEIDGKENIEILDALAATHEDGFKICPRCQKSPMILQDHGGHSVLVCENPYCNYVLPVPAFLNDLQQTDKKCLICPMNAVTYTKGGVSHYICINCYDIHVKNKSEQIGFCIGCVYHDACFNDELTSLELLDERPSIRESIQKRLSGEQADQADDA